VFYITLQFTFKEKFKDDGQIIFRTAYLVGVHDAEGFLELLDGALGEHGEDIASALLCFPVITKLTRF
jgi:hypothetical protein